MATALYSTKRVTNELVQELVKALKRVDSFGSIEVFVQDNKVTQITTRNITKTNGITIHRPTIAK